MREDCAIVLAVGQASDPRSYPAVTRGEFAIAELCELTNQGNSVAGKLPLQCCPNAPQQRNRFVGEEGSRLAAANNCKAARLVEIGGDLGEEFVVAQSDRHRNVERGFHPLGERSKQLGGAHAMKHLCAAEVEKS